MRPVSCPRLATASPCPAARGRPVARRAAHLLSLVLLLAATPPPLAGASERAAVAEALHAIRSDALQAHVDVLAADAFEGREAGSRGGRAAGGYLVRFFDQYGLQPAGDDGGFFQAFGAGYRNVLGLLEGSDPQLKHEVVVIGAHYDHVGFGSRSNSYGPLGTIHNGADDNASGTAAVIELMQAFRMLPEVPRRSVLFALWDGEEKGLLGSEHWANHPTVPLADVALVINLDMIGRLRDERVEVYGSRTSPGLRQLVSRSNRATGLRLDFLWELNSNSDHYSFYSRSIPVLMFHTGLHEDYHRPSDEADRINAEGLQAVARLVFRVVLELAERPGRPAFRPQARRETPALRRRLEEPPAAPPARLGISWDSSDTGPGLRVTQVRDRSPAAQAGLLPGDRLMSLDGHPIADGDAFRRQIQGAADAVVLEIQRPGADVGRPLRVTLAGSPRRLGLSWRADAAEPGTALVVRVDPGSPAAEAGLRVADRVYEVDGRPWVDDADLPRRLARSDGQPFELLVERQGRLLQLSVAP